mgnify:FL=1
MLVQNKPCESKCIFYSSVSTHTTLQGVDEEDLPWSTDKKAWVAIVVGAAAGFLTIPYTVWLRKKMFK